MEAPIFHTGFGEHRLLHFFETPHDLNKAEKPDEANADQDQSKKKEEGEQNEKLKPDVLNKEARQKALRLQQQAEKTTKDFDDARQETDKRAAQLRAEDTDVNLAKDATIVGLYAPDAHTKPSPRTETAVEQRAETVTRETSTEAREEKITAKESPDTARKLS